MEAARRDLLLNEESRKRRDRELASGASSSRVEVVERSSSEGAYTSMDTTEGVGSGKPTRLLGDIRLYASLIWQSVKLKVSARVKS